MPVAVVTIRRVPGPTRPSINANRASPLHLLDETLPAAAPVGPLERGNRSTVVAARPARYPAAVRERLRSLTGSGGLLLALALVAMLPLLVRRGGDADFFAHLRTAQAIADMRGLPGHELYTYTASSATWVDHEYGSELLLFGLPNLIAGKAGVSIAYGLVLIAGFLLILARMRLQPAPAVVAALALLLGAAVGVAVWGPRAQMITFTFTCLTLYWVELFIVRRSRAIYALPAVVLVWANLHAGFIFGLFIMLLAAGCELALGLVNRKEREHFHAARVLTLVLGASAVAALVNPYGPALYGYIWRTESSKALPQFVTEWLSPNFHHLNALPFELAILLLIAGLALRRPRLHQLVLALATLGLALQAVRHIAIFDAAATPVIAWSWGQAWRRYEVDRRVTRWLGPLARDLRTITAVGLVAAVIGVAAFIADALSKQDSATAANFPVAASDWLASHPQVGTRMFDEDGWNGYLSFRFYPQQNRRVFILSDPTLVGDRLMNDYLDVTLLRPDWQDVLSRHGVDYVVYEPDTALGSALDVDSSWKRVYTDSLAAIWVRV